MASTPDIYRMAFTTHALTTENLLTTTAPDNSHEDIVYINNPKLGNFSGAAPGRIVPPNQMGGYNSSYSYPYLSLTVSVPSLLLLLCSCLLIIYLVIR